MLQRVGSAAMDHDLAAGFFDRLLLLLDVRCQVQAYVGRAHLACPIVEIAQRGVVHERAVVLDHLVEACHARARARKGVDVPEINPHEDRFSSAHVLPDWPHVNGQPQLTARLKGHEVVRGDDLPDDAAEHAAEKLRRREFRGIGQAPYVKALDGIVEIPGADRVYGVGIVVQNDEQLSRLLNQLGGNGGDVPDSVLPRTAGGDHEAKRRSAEHNGLGTETAI